MLTIQEFSKRTGIPKSALRFYEEKKLLIPKRNEENHYRMYQEEQIELARLISSLRLANIPLKDIQQYVSATSDPTETDETGMDCRVKKTTENAGFTDQILESHQEDESIFLFERKAERVIWFLAEDGQGSFGEHLLKGKNELEKNNIAVNNYYLQYVSGRKSIKAWIGFGIDNQVNVTNTKLFEKEEHLTKSLCVATKFQGDFQKIENAYVNLVNYMREHNYIPSGSLLEMYHGNDLSQVTILIPVLKLGGE